jgi:hypothetical protein
MAFKRTENVFILGAGASHDYNFPLGKGLMDNVLQKLKSDTPYLKAVYKTGEIMSYSPHDVDSFLGKLDEFNQQESSLDSFVGSFADSEKKVVIQTIAKVCIASEIIRCEDKSNVRLETGWYARLFSMMYSTSNTYSSFMKLRLTIITFNFDRSIEFYLLNAIRKRWPEESENIGRDMLESFKFIHLHGSLGSILNSDAASYRPYQTIGWNEPSILAKAANNIKLHTESNVEAEPFEEAKQYIDRAKIIHFIGFGFHIDNMERLGLFAGKERRNRFGTIFRISPPNLVRELQTTIGLQLAQYSGDSLGLAEPVTSNTAITTYLGLAPFEAD